MNCVFNYFKNQYCVVEKITGQLMIIYKLHNHMNGCILKPQIINPGIENVQYNYLNGNIKDLKKN